jgi:hypothetical protein
MTIRHTLIESSKDKLILNLLQLSLSKVIKNACYQQVSGIFTEARKSILIEKGFVDIQWASSGAFSNSLLLPINIPIFKGILGYRVLVIRQGEQYRFDNINSINDLKSMFAGQGEFWGDTAILKSAGLSVVTTTQGRRLWYMLNKKRFDYLPLAVHEPWEDIALRPELKLTVEEKLMLVYPMALLFYVNQNNQQLYQAISKGMNIAMNDGSYHELLKKSDMFRAASKYANISNRKMIFIDNPNIDESLKGHVVKSQTSELIQILSQ